jgi:hypothetical protein
VSRQGESEKSGAAVSVYEKAIGGGGFSGDIVNKSRKNKGVILKKISGEEAELEVAHLFFDNFSGVRVDTC